MKKIKARSHNTIMEKWKALVVALLLVLVGVGVYEYKKDEANESHEELVASLSDARKSELFAISLYFTLSQSEVSALDRVLGRTNQTYVEIMNDEQSHDALLANALRIVGAEQIAGVSGEPLPLEGEVSLDDAIESEEDAIEMYKEIEEELSKTGAYPEVFSVIKSIRADEEEHLALLNSFKA